MGIFITLLTVLLLFVCILMVMIILMQRPKQEGLGAAFGGGMTDQMFGAQTTNVLQKGTVYFTIFYFVASTALAVMVARQQRGLENHEDRLLNAPTPEAVTPPAATPPGGPLDSSIPINLQAPDNSTDKNIDPTPDKATESPDKPAAGEEKTKGNTPKPAADPAVGESTPPEPPASPETGAEPAASEPEPEPAKSDG